MGRDIARRFRYGVFVLALLIATLIPLDPDVGRGAPSPITIVSPPAGLAVPIGQHIGVQYRLASGAPARLELFADGVVLVSEWVEPGRDVTHAWTPTALGPHEVTVRGSSADGRLLGTASVAVIGLPPGSPVRAPSP